MKTTQILALVSLLLGAAAVIVFHSDPFDPVGLSSFVGSSWASLGACDHDAGQCRSSGSNPCCAASWPFAREKPVCADGYAVLADQGNCTFMGVTTGATYKCCRISGRPTSKMFAILAAISVGAAIFAVTKCSGRDPELPAQLNRSELEATERTFRLIAQKGNDDRENEVVGVTYEQLKIFLLLQNPSGVGDDEEADRVDAQAGARREVEKDHDRFTKSLLTEVERIAKQKPPRAPMYENVVISLGFKIAPVWRKQLAQNQLLVLSEFREAFRIVKNTCSPFVWLNQSGGWMSAFFHVVFFFTFFPLERPLVILLPRSYRWHKWWQYWLESWGFSSDPIAYGLRTVAGSAIWFVQVALWYFAWKHKPYLCDSDRPVLFLQTVISCLFGPIFVSVLAYCFSSRIGDKDSAWAAQISELQLLNDTIDIEHEEEGRRVRNAYDLLRHCREQSRQLTNHRWWVWRRLSILCEFAAHLLLVAYLGHTALLSLPRNESPDVDSAINAVEWAVRLSATLLGGSASHLDVFSASDCPHGVIALSALWDVVLVLGLSWVLRYFVDMYRLLNGDICELTDIVNDERCVWEERKRRDREEATKAKEAGPKPDAAVGEGNKTTLRRKTAQIFLDLIIPENLVAWENVRKTILGAKRLRLGSEVLSHAATSAAVLWILVLVQAFDIAKLIGFDIVKLLRTWIPFDAVGFAVLAHTLTFTIFPALSNTASIKNYRQRHIATLTEQQLKCHKLCLERQLWTGIGEEKLKDWAYKPRDFGFTTVKIPSFVENNSKLVKMLGRNYHNMWCMKKLKYKYHWAAAKNNSEKLNDKLKSYDEQDQADQNYNEREALHCVRTAIWMGFTVSDVKQDKPRMIRATHPDIVKHFNFSGEAKEEKEAFGPPCSRKGLQDVELIDIWQERLLPDQLQEVLVVLGQRLGEITHDSWAARRKDKEYLDIDHRRTTNIERLEHQSKTFSERATVRSDGFVQPLHDLPPCKSKSPSEKAPQTMLKLRTQSGPTKRSPRPRKQLSGLVSHLSVDVDIARSESKFAVTPSPQGSPRFRLQRATLSGGSASPSPQAYKGNKRWIDPELSERERETERQLREELVELNRDPIGETLRAVAACGFEVGQGTFRKRALAQCSSILLNPEEMLEKSDRLFQTITQHLTSRGTSSAQHGIWIFGIIEANQIFGRNVSVLSILFGPVGKALREFFPFSGKKKSGEWMKRASRFLPWGVVGNRSNHDSLPLWVALAVLWVVWAWLLPSFSSPQRRSRSLA